MIFLAGMKKRASICTRASFSLDPSLLKVLTVVAAFACFDVGSDKLLDISRFIGDTLELVYDVLLCRGKAGQRILLFIFCRIPLLRGFLSFAHNISSPQNKSFNSTYSRSSCSVLHSSLGTSTDTESLPLPLFTVHFLELSETL